MNAGWPKNPKHWGDAKTYAWLHNVSLTQQYRTQLLVWLEWENPDLYKLVLKELARDKKTPPRGGEQQREVDGSPGEGVEGSVG